VGRRERVEPTGSPERYVAERALAAVKSLTNARTAAVFKIDGERLQLFASVSADQQTLELMTGIAADHKDALARGEMFYSPELHTDRRLGRLAAAVSWMPSALCVVPAFHREKPVAYLYVDSLEPYFCTRHDQQRLADLCSLMGEALGGGGLEDLKGRSEEWAQYLEATDPVFNRERDELLLLLNRTDWNIARVARILGVSRRTLYVRLEKYRIPREHVEKKGAGGRRTGRGTSETRTYPRFGSTFVVKPGAKEPDADEGEEAE
jgi:regulatory Fis family protein